MLRTACRRLHCGIVLARPARVGLADCSLLRASERRLSIAFAGARCMTCVTHTDVVIRQTG
ncbi:hypothetical protein C791_3811 [Amycolatopsis azurea DSM 43854]|uniref:Uncharacterized protein n=1 Tax=Amycolatopsis azurea DSM 43854 TaxID=1238180 RepID=M2PNZ2_9PSEU|nr:hypothetical protein C791_3811 [Amycolatopsis azurea DSM 43854]